MEFCREKYGCLSADYLCLMPNFKPVKILALVAGLGVKFTYKVSDENHTHNILLKRSFSQISKETNHT